jgi:multidrug efflux pump subunit AcrA (membrane-fusion protein)
MSSKRLARVNPLIIGIVCVVVALGAGLIAIPSLRQMLGIGRLEGTAAAAETASSEGTAQICKDEKGRCGLQLSQLAVEGLQLKTATATRAVQLRPLPAQSGTVNFDNDRLFQVPSRFSGEVVEIAQVDDEPTPSGEIKKRPLRYGDRVKQSQLLAVVYSQPLGSAKAVLVDAISALRLSKARLDRFQLPELASVLPRSVVEQQERQVESDINTLRSAERSLYLWKLTKEEVQGIKDEAKTMLDEKLVRDAEAEAKKWGRVEIRVPVFDPQNMDRELVIVEKNTSIGSMVDPINTPTPLFRVADMSRLQIWAHPPEEYLPMLRDLLEHPERGPARWDVRYQTDPADRLPEVLEFYQIAPSLEPFNHSPMVIGYLNNGKGNDHLVGQFVTVTLFVAPEPNTVEIPTDALNEVNGESLVWVQPDPAKAQYIQRRVVVVSRFKDKSYVRSQLTTKDEEQSKQEVQKGRLSLETLHAGERVVTRGVLEMTACLEDLMSKEVKK